MFTWKKSGNNMWALPSCFKITTTKIIDFIDQKIGHLEIFKICIYLYNHKNKLKCQFNFKLI